MKLRLTHIFVLLTIVAVWLWSILRWPDYPGAKWTAIVFTAIAVSGASWGTLTAVFASLYCMLEFQTCACGHLASWPAFAITMVSSLIAWCETNDAFRKDSKCGFAVALCVATMTSLLSFRILEDIFILGHHPIWPNSQIPHSHLPATIDSLFTASIFAVFGAPICVIILQLYNRVKHRLGDTTR